MKRIIGVFIVLFCAIAVKAQMPVVPYVDERTELVSIVFRLAGAKEYVADNLKDYMNDIDTYFAAHKNHKVIKLAQNLRSQYGVSYDAVMSMATHIEIVNQKIKIKGNIKQGSIERRWTEDNIIKFVKLLNQFYKESKFPIFFEQHQDLYQKATSNFNKILENVDFGWFVNFYGEQNKNNFSLIISLVNGPSNYGSTVSYTNKPEDIYAIIGTWASNESGEPIYPAQVIGTVIHEFSHSFCNGLIEEFYTQLEEQGKAFFAFVKEKMTRQAYGTSKTMLYEILVRACVIKYYESVENNPSNVKKHISRELSNGFLWIEELVNSLSVYEKNRDKYPTLKSYMPEIVKLQNSLSPEKIHEKLTNFSGPLNGVFMESKLAVIHPTQDLDIEALSIAQQYISAIYDRFFKPKGGILLADTIALRTDLSEYGIIAYGTMESNLFLKQYSSSFPFKIENQTIYADKEYTDKNIKFITCVPNPHNPKKGMSIYTALSNKNIQDINNVFHGSEDYILFLNRETVISEGFYNKNEKWTF